MDYYKTLKINENATKKEIEEAYKLLSDTYNPLYNTSPVAYKRYRDINYAYKMLQNKELLTLKEEQEIVLKEEAIKFDYEKFFNQQKEINYLPLEKEKIEIYQNIKVENEIIDLYKYQKEIEIDYLDILLNCQIEVKVFQNKECENSITHICPECNGIGIVQYQQKMITCPKCNGKKEIKECHCHYNNGLKEEKIVKLDLSKIDFNKPMILLDTYLTFKVVNKDKIKENKNEIEVNYDLAKEEILNGLEKIFHTDYGILSINTKTFEDYSLNYKDKKITFHFHTFSFNGDDIEKKIIFAKKDLHKTLYLDLDNLTYSYNKSATFNYEFVLPNINGSIRIKEKGEKGYLEGKNGDLILNYFACNHYFKSNKEVVIEETSLLSNLFKDVKIKGRNYLLEKEDYLVILTGNGKKKDYLKNYFWFKALIYLLWLLIPFILLVAPLSKELFISLCIVSVSYAILANVLLRLKI